MRKGKEFNNILDECLERLLVKGETIEQCLQGFPEHADALKPLLETSLAVKKASTIQPHPEFREKARYQFYSALRETKTERRRSSFSWSWQPRWAAVVGIVLALLLASGGTVTVASGSMPDEPLYPVKLATEQARLALTPSALGKAELYAKLADRRVIEIVGMADKNKPEQIERATQRLDAYLVKIADLASTQEIASSKAKEPAVEEAPLPLERAKEGKEKRIKAERRARLKATVKNQAINHSARLRAVLKTVPESAKPALLRAIAVSETGYEKALESLD